MSETPRPDALITAPPRLVVMLCVHNSARSQMAEGFARKMAPEGVAVWSAGSRPTPVNPLAVQVMQEIGIDISAQQSKRIDEVPIGEADTIVTLCGEGELECPAVAPKVRRIHWPLDDPTQAPEERRLEAFRTARDEIRWRVSSLWPGGD